MKSSAEEHAGLEQARAEIIGAYPALWRKMIRGWSSPGRDAAWLMYSANYLFRTADLRWAIDPLGLNCRLPQAPAMDAARDLEGLELVLLTHRHWDHLDAGLLRQLKAMPIQWVVPEDIRALVQREVSLPEGQILVPEPLKPLQVNGLVIIPFKAQHWEENPVYPGGRKGVPSIGYLVEQGGRRWLFPGDTRNYDPARMPEFGPVDVLFAHLWLGRNAALQSPPPLLEQFCRFCLALQPRRIVLTHLEEWGRHAPDFWSMQHASLVIAHLRRQAPSLPVEIARTGDEIALS
jgi:L-ascorbate metabolism protein UlaG (beta-lactamase superfamily)